MSNSVCRLAGRGRARVPQELGDFGILVHSGWSRRAALLFNLASGLTFLVGALIAYALSGALDVALLLPFAAGNFLYIAVSDLLPQLRSEALSEELVQLPPSAPACCCSGWSRRRAVRVERPGRWLPRLRTERSALRDRRMPAAGFSGM